MKQFCKCEDWNPCGCGNQEDGRHCMYCCHYLTQEQLKEAVRRGWLDAGEIEEGTK